MSTKHENLAPAESGLPPAPQPPHATAHNGREGEAPVLPADLPVLPARGLVIFPHVVLPVAVTEPRDVRLVNDVVLNDRLMVMVATRENASENPTPDQLYPIGCAVNVLKLMRFPDDTTRLLVQGMARVSVDKYTSTEPYLRASITRLDSVVTDDLVTRALARSVVEQFQKLVDLSPNLPDELKPAIMSIDDSGRLADVVASSLNLTVSERQEALEIASVADRLRKVAGYLNREVETAELSTKITSQVKSEMDKDQRDFILRRQLKAIQHELGEEDEQTAEANELRKRLAGLKLPPEARKEAERELDRLQRMPPQASEYHVARTYLEWMLALPWNTSTKDKLDVAAARKVLNHDHYNLEKVKERIIEHLAVHKLQSEARGPILCFVGPPGTGKTSLGKSIARAMGRKFVRISLGGIRDEAEIRGHRRTYVGALPGRIIQGIRKAESNNPVFMLDEVDKLGADFHGDPSAALLEVLDPEQNFSFNDHYLDVPFDLSKAMFITTANILDPIPPALRDRMEILELPGYTQEEKVKIARRYLIPRQLAANGLTRNDLAFPDPVINALIANYTREAGLRNLEREIGALCRKHAAVVAQKSCSRRKRTLAVSDLAALLGPPRFRPDAAERSFEPGVATGLAWTAAGGDILFIESTRFPGSGRLQMTGQLGDVMKESALAALSYLRARARSLNLKQEDFAHSDIHVHVPAGAIPKDGPSAGITIAMSLLSLFLDKPVRPDLAMTGEITLRGRVLPVGGIKEKVLAARQAGIRTIILPKWNQKDMSEVPQTVRKGMRFIFIESVNDIVPHAFVRTPSSHKPARAGKRQATHRPTPPIRRNH